MPFEAGEQLATELGSVTGQDLAAELGAAIDGKLKSPPSTVGLRVSNAAIDRMLENEVLLTAVQERHRDANQSPTLQCGLAPPSGLRVAPSHRR